MAVEDMVERAIIRTDDAGSRVEKVAGEAAARLEANGSIGALLRF